jgi:LemA protein
MIIAIIVSILFIAIIVIAIYNSFIKKKNQVENAFSSIDVMLKKRYDLIPNLIETVKSYMKHEKDLLTKVTELRSKAINPNVSADEKVAIDNEVRQTLGGIMVAVEQYPDLKASENFMQLQASFNEIEEQISAARRFYNSAVLQYNNAVEMFPSSIIAQMMNFSKRNFFEIPDVERENVDAKKLFND